MHIQTFDKRVKYVFSQASIPALYRKITVNGCTIMELLRRNEIGSFTDFFKDCIDILVNHKYVVIVKVVDGIEEDFLHLELTLKGHWIAWQIAKHIGSIDGTNG